MLKYGGIFQFFLQSLSIFFMAKFNLFLSIELSYHTLNMYATGKKALHTAPFKGTQD
jgi:hypothetical protein